MVHLDDDGTGFIDRITFTMSGWFDAFSFDILGHNRYCSETLGCDIPFDNVLVSGYRDGVLVAQDEFYAPNDPLTHLFGAAFTVLDTLVIQTMAPTWFREDTTSPDEDYCWVVAPCTHFDIDNITLALSTSQPSDPITPVPLPPGFLLLASAVGLLALCRRNEPQQAEVIREQGACSPPARG